MDIQIYTQTIIRNDNYIFVKPICDVFQIDYDNQVKKFKKDPILKNQTSKKTDETYFGDKIPRLAVSASGFVRWIQLITPSIVQVSLREKFQYYQVFIFDYLYGTLSEKETTHQVAAHNYTRLKKLKNLKSKINYEIRVLQNELNSNLEIALGIQQIPYSKQLKN